jgi:hypothetical protein
VLQLNEGDVPRGTEARLVRVCQFEPLFLTTKGALGARMQSMRKRITGADTGPGSRMDRQPRRAGRAADETSGLPPAVGDIGTRLSPTYRAVAA